MEAFEIERLELLGARVEASETERSTPLVGLVASCPFVGEASKIVAGIGAISFESINMGITLSRVTALACSDAGAWAGTRRGRIRGAACTGCRGPIPDWKRTAGFLSSPGLLAFSAPNWS